MGESRIDAPASSGPTLCEQKSPITVPNVPEMTCRPSSRGPPGVTSDKTHVEHNEPALTLIADIRGDMDFRRNGPQAHSTAILTQQPEASIFAVS